ncbi:hypothetical protein bsdtb5_43240 [Anaeromicropila herbilytica]|uniref:Uncharacterized protein n=1 Tax=Anaeromicropila herbilytica TaxID=2785025 RepID=A0A7R7EQD5_9FIRM|nr:hypothetical protein bsdtb5_43240 [Anaeromicropila herbilytica]
MWITCLTSEEFTLYTLVYPQKYYNSLINLINNTQKYGHIPQPRIITIENATNLL